MQRAYWKDLAALMHDEALTLLNAAALVERLLP